MQTPCCSANMRENNYVTTTIDRHMQTSKQQFEQYKKELDNKQTPGDAGQTKSGVEVKRERLRSSRELIVNFYQLLKGQRRAVLFSLMTLTVSTLLTLLPPVATKFVVDFVLGDQQVPEVWRTRLHLPKDRWELLVCVTVAALLVTFIKVAFHIWGRWYATRSTKRIQMSVRKKVFEHAVRLPLHRVYALKSGGIASILRNDAGSVGDLIFGMIYNPWRAIIQLAGSMVILAYVDWRLLLGAVVLLPIIYFTHRTWIGRIRPQFRNIRATREDVDALAAESFGGMRVVRAFSRQRAETGRIMRGNHMMGRQELFAWWWSRTIEIIWASIIPTSSAAILLYCGHEVIAGRLTLGDMTMFLVYLLLLLEPLAVLASSAATFQNSLSGLDRILDLLHEPREMQTDGTHINLSKNNVAGSVVFENVSFQYEGTSAFALQNISFTAQPGEVIALVGASGSGKTTLCNLVARFYDPQEGRVLLDGKDLRQFDVESYRNLLGLVEQDVFLFDGTVAENIGYANRKADDAAIHHAAHVANAEEFIQKLPQGYDTLIGERGVKLSGGQRQRIAIARAVLADPKLLILDEATSNLDTESERLIQSSLNKLMQNRTSFVVAHRLSTITHANLILVLEDGKVVEQGSHEELMQSGTRYQDMIHLQTNFQSTV